MYKNYQRKSGKNALVTNKGATFNTWAGFTHQNTVKNWNER